MGLAALESSPFDKRLIRGKIRLRRNAAFVAEAAGSRNRESKR